MFQLILIPFAAGLITQCLKLVFDGIPKNLTWKHLISDYGGMPSSHTAIVASLAAAAGLREGWDSAAFALTAILAMIVIRDALGFRREIGRNAVLTNQLARKISPDRKKFPLLNDQLGHSLAEVTIGGIIGIILAALAHFLIF